MGAVAAFSRQRGSDFADDAGSEGGFADRVARLLDRIDCRLADSGEQREAIFRLRYQAYVRENGIPPNTSGTFTDPYDEIGNVWIFGLYIDSELASSIRVHIASEEHPEFPSGEVFADYLQPEIDAGKVLVDSTRFVADEKLARHYRALPYATLRLSGMAARYFGADYLLAAVRTEHQAFYRRVFRYQTVCGPRPYPLLAKPICLMMVHYPAFDEQVHRRYPFFRSTFSERRMLFEHSRPRLAAARKPPQPQANDQNEILLAPCV